ncbi:MAG: glycosyl transferase [Phycisphaerales bacterium]
MLANRYGQFTNGGRAFVITDPDTPTPWTNVICNGRYGLIVSQNGGGFSFLDHCQLNVITRWNMDLVRDDSGRWLFLRDLDANRTWSLSPQPCRPRYERFSCTHRPGRTSFETEIHGIAATWELSVAASDQVELWRVTIENRTDRTRRLRLGSYFEWCCGVAPDVKREFHKLFFTTVHDRQRRAIIVTKNLWEAPFGTRDDHWNRAWPHAAACAIVGLDETFATSDKADFLGRYAPQSDPRGMREPVRGIFGRFHDACSALGGDIELRPRESRTVSILTAIEDSQEAVGALLDRFADQRVIDAAFDASDAMWKRLLSPSGVTSDMPDFDLLNSTWLAYQAICARLFARTGYYQQSGAFGYRDQLQDSQVWLPRDPARCRAQILHHAAHQFADGSVYHWWNPITETGLRSACSDDYLWLPYMTASYIRDTGDAGILSQRIGFVDDAEPVTLAEHGRRAIARAMSRMSRRGLPLIGDNDWNDGLSNLGNQTEGESVWLAFFLIDVLEQFGCALRLDGDSATAEAYGAERRRLIEAVNEHAWDGRWFRRATDVDGRWLGSKDCTEGQIYLNAQTWAILADATTPDRADAAWQSVLDRLLTPYGPLLLAPAYTVPDPKIGYLTRYAPGARENGGVYMHAATWALAAACKRRDVEAVERIWKSISPPLRGQDADAYFAEPYVLPGNVDGPLSPTPGRAGWTWYTGSAAWLNRVSLEWIVGIRPTWEGLRIDPCAFAAMGRVRATRVWRGRSITVAFDAATFDPAGEPVLSLAGRRLAGCVLTEADIPASGEVHIEVAWEASREPVTIMGATKGVRSRS